MKQLLPALALAAFAATSANAATLVVDLKDVPSYTYLGSAENVSMSFDLGAGAYVTGFAFSFTVTAFDPSWLSEISMMASNTSGTGGFFFTPAPGLDGPGTHSADGFADLVWYGLDFTTDADGLLWLDFFETYSDEANPDGLWNGTLTFTYTPGTPTGPVVPEPATWAMMIAGFGLVGASMRRRRVSLPVTAA
ncbi:PEPxxWA-CTERM sorting domain-containing protein [Sandaracinobacter neustonicus]|uniref:PEPxxWA-CTERM sorting domain-containing protein n=1 Tax=Sandaracinobacter neustonicus TaxID=1715348 RepID=UPI001F1E95D4|nr:PEPxxWA-CTERM sorting domain-containing protein [Sandaracinobacter neustonicus]